MPKVYSASSFQSLSLKSGEQTASQRLSAVVSPGPGDMTTPNNVQPLDEKAVYPAIFAIKSGTNKDGLRQLVPDKVDIVMTLGEDAYVEQTVHVTNLSADVASMGYYLARGRGNFVVSESQQIGDFPLERTVKTNADADATMAAVEAGATHTGSIAETSENSTFVKLAKVPPNTQVVFSTRTRLPNLKFAQVVSNKTDKSLFADAAVLLPISPLGANVKTTVRVVLRPGFELSLPDKDAATHDAKAFALSSAVLWAEYADFDHVFESGLACPTVFQCRVTKSARKECEDVAGALGNMALDSSSNLPSSVTVVRSPHCSVGFDPVSGAPRRVSLVDVDVPLGVQVASKCNDLDFFLIVDESGSTYARSGSNELTNLQMAKKSAVAILTAFVKEHVPLLRKGNILGARQRVFVSVLMFHHGCRSIVERLDVTDSSTDLQQCCDLILADAPAGGTNFCSFASAMKTASLHTPDSLVVACVLTDGGAYDLPSFMVELNDLRSQVADVRTVVVGFGAWVCEKTARRIQTDGHAMVSDIDDTNVVRLAMRLVPKAIISATRQVKLTLEGATIISAVRTDDAEKPFQLTTSLSDDGRSFVINTMVEPGATFRVLCLEEKAQAIRVLCGGHSVTPFEAFEEDNVDPLEVLGMVDKLYLKTGVALLPIGEFEHQNVITAIGIKFELGTSFTKPISTLKLPEAMVAPSSANRPVAESLVLMITPPPPMPHCTTWDGDESDVVQYRSLSSVSFSHDSSVAYRSLSDPGSIGPSLPPDAASWLRCMAKHVDFAEFVSRMNQALAALEEGSPAKRPKLEVDEDLLEGIDAASDKHAPKPRLMRNVYPFKASSLDLARACYHNLCVINAIKPVPLANLSTAAEIRDAASVLRMGSH